METIYTADNVELTTVDRSSKIYFKLHTDGKICFLKLSVSAKGQFFR